MDGTRMHALDAVEGGECVMVKKRGHQFVVNNLPFFVHGFNTYWLMVFAVDPSTRNKVSDVFHQASSIGLNVCRTWAFNDGCWRALQLAPSVYDEDVFKALDFVVSEARRYNIRLILSFTNNWEDYGGKPQYVKWGRAAGLDLSSDDDFFSDPNIKAYYKAHVTAILTRVNTITNLMYKDDPTIFAWELMNEPQSHSDPSGDKLQAWIEEMACFLKSIDPNHLLEIGLEGFYGLSTPERLNMNPNSYAGHVGTDFIRNHQAPGIDFASVHIYTDAWLPHSDTDAHLKFVKAWMQSHMEDAESVLRMPVVFGEFGVSIKDERFSTSFRDAYIDTVHKTLQTSAGRGGSGGGCLLWQLFPEGTEHMDDGYAVVLHRSPATSLVLSHHSSRLHSLKSEFHSKYPWSHGPKDMHHSHEEL